MIDWEKELEVAFFFVAGILLGFCLTDSYYARKFAYQTGKFESLKGTVETLRQESKWIEDRCAR